MWADTRGSSQIQVSGGGRVCVFAVVCVCGCTIHWTNDKLRVSIEATGSDQDKPLGSHAVLSLGADYMHTFPSVY